MQATRIADHPTRRAARCDNLHRQPLGGGKPRLICHAVRNQTVKIKRHRGVRPPVCISARNIQNRIDMVQQDLAGCGHHINQILLPPAQIGSRQQIQRPQQTVQRGAHLVAHHGDEIGLGPLPRLCLFQGHRQRRLRAATVRDIAHQRHDHIPRCNARAAQRQFNRKTHPVRPHCQKFDAQRVIVRATGPCRSRLQHRADFPGLCAGKVRRQQQIEGTKPQRRLARVTKNHLGRRIDINNPAAPVCDDNSIGRGRKNRLQARRCQVAGRHLCPPGLDQAQQHPRQQNQRQHQNHRQQCGVHQRLCHRIAAQIGGGRGLGPGGQRQPPCRLPDVGQCFCQPSQSRAQFTVRPVDHRHRPVQKRPQDFCIGSQLWRLQLCAVIGTFTQHRHARINHVKPGSKLGQIGGLFKGCGPFDRQLQAQDFHFRLHKRPMGGIRA